MRALKDALRAAIAAALPDVVEIDIPVQPAPPGQGDLASPVAFMLARRLRKPPPQIAAEIAARLVAPAGVTAVRAARGFINFDLAPATTLAAALAGPPRFEAVPGRTIVEHTAVNPNKEWHVGHLRNVALGDSVARILSRTGQVVEVQNLIDDAGRQVAESIAALERYPRRQDPSRKFDHWLGEGYVRLHQELEDPGLRPGIELAVDRVLQECERGAHRELIDRVVRAHLQTAARFGAVYDLLVWETDLLTLLDPTVALLEKSPWVSRPAAGKYAGCLVLDTSSFASGMEDPIVVLIRSNGTATYYLKDITLQLWKYGLLAGMAFREYAVQDGGRVLWSTAPDGAPERPLPPADRVINVIDVRQSFPQLVVRTALSVAGRPDLQEASRHLAYEIVTLEGSGMSGRKGRAVAADDVLDEAVRRALAVIQKKNPGLADAAAVAEMIGIGAVRFVMVKSEPRRQIDFRWEQALSFDGDAAPYVQYAHARAASILRAAAEKGLSATAGGAVAAHAGEPEKALALTVLRFEEAVEQASRELAPHLVAQYALDLATAWNSYYHHKDAEGRSDTTVVAAPAGVRETRLALVARVRETLAEALGLLGVGAPDEM